MKLSQKFRERLANTQEHGIAVPAPQVKAMMMLLEMALDVIEQEMDDREVKNAKPVKP